ncbi:MAG: 16S rRNA (adenine(1518)-N(6)/adenine(1519)-N(6))-dimethyltransferase [Candidatus Doudnabacteria bacterium]|nr:16S rRNA (adenine(1518)-N(6)/adenine(1519)-N(6))-dimethyltransferase [Candidatus Doudnabacteria bacterium]
MDNLTDINYLKSFLKRSGLKPKHYLGQNFLVDEAVLDEIVAAAELKKTDTVLEVGPGLGILTQELLKRADKVIAVEKDRRLFEILRKISNIEYRSTKQAQISNDQNPKQKFRTFEHLDLDIVSDLGFRASDLQLVNGDILRFHLDKHLQGPYKVVANIPYYLTSHLIQYFLTQSNKPKLLVLMVQKEVGERVVAEPGELSVLGISVQFFADAEIVQRRSDFPPRIGGIKGGRGKAQTVPPPAPPILGGEKLQPAPLIIPKTSFWPQPEVDSVILRIVPKEKFPEVKNQKLFFRILKTAFRGKRKQIKNSLSAYLPAGKAGSLELIVKAGIDPKLRPQDLTINQWIDLYKRLEESV